MPRFDPDFAHELDNIYGPVAMDFTITQTPEGAAPERIREQWIDAVLPVREANLGQLATCYLDLLSGTYKVNEEPVVVVGAEAIEALRAIDKHEAADYWTPYALGIFALNTFMFRAHEGKFSPHPTNTPHQAS